MRIAFAVAIRGGVYSNLLYLECEFQYLDDDDEYNSDDDDDDDDDEYSSDDVGKKFYISRVNSMYQVQTFGSNRSLRVIDV